MSVVTVVPDPVHTTVVSPPSNTVNLCNTIVAVSRLIVTPSIGNNKTTHAYDTRSCVVPTNNHPTTSSLTGIPSSKLTNCSLSPAQRNI